MFKSCFINNILDKDFNNLLNTNNYNSLINFLKTNNINNKKLHCYISQSITKEDKIIYYLLVLSIYFSFIDFNIYCEPKLSFEKEYIINLLYNESNCITFTINQTNNTIIIDSLDKCGHNNGNKLLNILEQFANSIKITQIKLLDRSHIYFCNERYQISLSMLSILSTGKSWYNNLGYLSTNFNKEQIINNKLIEKKLIDVIKFDTLNNTIKDTITRITSNIDIDINNITIKELFILIKSYLKTITNNCDQLTINNILNINNLIEILQQYIIYDYTLIKNISSNIGGKKTRKKRKNKKFKNIKKSKSFKK